MAFPASLVTDYGAPQKSLLNVTVLATGGLHLELSIVNKTATRLPESMSLRFQPMMKNSSSMLMDKLGEAISVLDVMRNGSKHLHAIGTGGVTYASNPGVSFSSPHVPVVCVGAPTPFPVPMATPDVDEGFSFNLVNNIWGTNYVMWYPYVDADKSIKLNFKISVPKST